MAALWKRWQLEVILNEQKHNCLPQTDSKFQNQAHDLPGIYTIYRYTSIYTGTVLQ